MHTSTHSKMVSIVSVSECMNGDIHLKVNFKQLKFYSYFMNFSVAYSSSLFSLKAIHLLYTNYRINMLMNQNSISKSYSSNSVPCGNRHSLSSFTFSSLTKIYFHTYSKWTRHCFMNLQVFSYLSIISDEAPTWKFAIITLELFKKVWDMVAPDFFYLRNIKMAVNIFIPNFCPQHLKNVFIFNIHIFGM